MTQSMATGSLEKKRLLGAWLLKVTQGSGSASMGADPITRPGGKAHQVFPEGWILISIPYNWIPIITQNLKEMKWTLPSYTDGREKFLKRKDGYIGELAQKSQNP